MLRYIDEIWMPYVKNSGSIVCLDSFRAHALLGPTMYMPLLFRVGVLLYLDVCLNKPFKSLLRLSWQLSESEKQDKDNPL